MNEKVAIRKQAKGVLVAVNRSDGPNAVRWQTTVLGPTEETVAAAIKECRRQCDMLLRGIQQVGAAEEAAA